MNIDLPSPRLISFNIFKDDRGFFFESFNKKKLNEQLGLNPHQDWVQDNQSFSKAGVLRGLHFQNPQAQGKLVRVLQGKIFDVVVDLRKSSSHFKQWKHFILEASNNEELWVPPGFAHGFYAFEDSVVFYKTTEYYNPKSEQILIWNDPEINIQWPFQGVPILSSKDKMGLPFYQLRLFE